MVYIPDLDLTSVWVGDVPESPTTAHFYDELGNQQQISHFASWHAEMFDPAGVSKGTLTGTDPGQSLEFTWPETSILDVPGIYRIVVTFQDDNGVIVKAEPWRFAVKEYDGWLDLEQARQAWADAPASDVLLYNLLDVAKIQVIEYAPALAAGVLPPANYLQGQLLQARAIYMAAQTNSSENVGLGDYQVRVFPLDWNIRALLRPKTPKVVVA